MNQAQEIWWRQTRSDKAVLELLRREGADACHQLHYLQMVTEKLAKAYFWQKEVPPAKSHARFRSFSKALGGAPQSQRTRLIRTFGFRKFKDFQNLINLVSPLAEALEGLAPALAQDGPNPEYPWPGDAPAHAPSDFAFPIWTELNKSRGRELINFIRLAVDRFSQFA